MLCVRGCVEGRGHVVVRGEVHAGARVDQQPHLPQTVPVVVVSLARQEGDSKRHG